MPLAAAAVMAAGGCDLGSDDEPQEERQRADEPRAEGSLSLVERLRRGGYVLAFRHAATDFSMTDTTRDGHVP